MNVFYPYRHYVVSLILFVCITLLSQLFRENLETINIILIHLLPVIVIALQGNFVATTIVTTLSIALLALYLPPEFVLWVHELIYLWSFIIFFIVGYTITFQAKRLHLNTVREILYNTLSHDLKTPLSSIMGNATFLLESRPIDPAIRYKSLAQIIESSRQMNRLIGNLLDSARLKNAQTPLKKGWCDLEELIGVALYEFRIPIADRPLKVTISSDFPLFFGDCGLLSRLLVNLLDNALKHSGQEKSIRIAFTADSKSIRLLFFNECDPIPQQDLAQLFEKFYRPENSADISGSGIGLSICKDITQAHHGDIRAYNSENGISFEVTLPILKHPESFEKEAE